MAPHAPICTPGKLHAPCIAAYHAAETDLAQAGWGWLGAWQEWLCSPLQGCPPAELALQQLQHPTRGSAAGPPVQRVAGGGLRQTRDDWALMSQPALGRAAEPIFGDSKRCSRARRSPCPALCQGKCQQRGWARFIDEVEKCMMIRHKGSSVRACMLSGRAPRADQRSPAMALQAERAVLPQGGACRWGDWVSPVLLPQTQVRCALAQGQFTCKVHAPSVLADMLAYRQHAAGT